MAGTLTVTQVPKITRYGKEINKITIDWTSDASGNADVTVDLFGYLVKAVTKPGAAAPTDLYDITIVDPDGSACDAAGGLLVDRSSTLTEQKYLTISGSSVPVLCAGTYTFTVANAGNAKNGTCYLYLVDDL